MRGKKELITLSFPSFHPNLSLNSLTLLKFYSATISVLNKLLCISDGSFGQAPDNFFRGRVLKSLRDFSRLSSASLAHPWAPKPPLHPFKNYSGPCCKLKINLNSGLQPESTLIGWLTLNACYKTIMLTNRQAIIAAQTRACARLQTSERQ